MAAKALPSLRNRPIRHVRKKQRRRKRPKCLEGTDDITEVGNNRYAVERDLVDRYAKDLEALSRLARVSWHENEAGKVDGFEVRRVRCGSVLYEAGLRNGDVVHAVNGRRIRSLARAIPLWWQLRRRPVVHVRITRGDESMRLWYRLS
jgi:type II secretory pathway component PulC